MTSTAEDPPGSAHKASEGSTSRLLRYADPVAAVVLAVLAAVGANQGWWSLVLVALAVSAVVAGGVAALERRGRITHPRGRAMLGFLVALFILGAWLYAFAVTGMALLRAVSQ